MPRSTVQTVTTTRSIVVPELPGDQSVYLHSASGTLYIGGPDLTAANGYRLDNGDKLTIMVGDHEPLYAITSSGSATLYVLSQIN
jgi:protein involved in polysaccharide export with SLBB domain